VLNFNPATGVLSGTPGAGTGGPYPLTATATNVTGTNVQSFTLVVNQTPAITNANTTAFTVGVSGAFHVGATGYPTPAFTLSGTLPNGVGFNPATQMISGTPAAATGGSYPVTLTATNVAGTNTQSFTLTVNQTPAITSVNSTTFTVGHAGSFQMTGNGFPAPSFIETNIDVRPGGVSFNNGTLSGTPASGSGGVYTLHFFATNSAGSAGPQTFTLTVNEVPSVTCPANIVTNASNGVCSLPSISFAATATGYPAPLITYQISGSQIVLPYAFPIGTNIVTSVAANSTGTNTCSFTVTVSPGVEPQLAIQRSGANAVVSWPSGYSCYTLEYATALSSNTWSAYLGPFATNGGTITITNRTATNGIFFRLSH
jgi:hypothetical protein